MSPEEAAIRERHRLLPSRGGSEDIAFLLGVIDDQRELNIKLMLELQEAHDERDDLAQQVVRLLDGERAKAGNERRCTCGFGGFHDDQNLRCERNTLAALDGTEQQRAES